MPKCGREEEWIRSVITGHRSDIYGFYRLKTRKASNFRFIEFNIKVNAQMSVTSSHEITRTLEKIITGRFPDATINIHVEPCEGDCTDECMAGCFLEEKGKILKPSR